MVEIDVGFSICRLKKSYAWRYLAASDRFVASVLLSPFEMDAAEQAAKKKISVLGLDSREAIQNAFTRGWARAIGGGLFVCDCWWGAGATFITLSITANLIWAKFRECNVSQLFSYFVCARPLIDEWIDAQEQDDEELQNKIEAKMPRMMTLKNVGDVELAILSKCSEAGVPDVYAAVGDVELVRAISEQEGPWILVVHAGLIRAVASMTVTDNVIERWVDGVAEYLDVDAEYYRELLSFDSADALRELCQYATAQNLEVFVCFHG